MRTIKETKKMLKIIFPDMAKFAEVGYGANGNVVYLVREREKYYLVTELHCGMRLVHQVMYNGDFRGTVELLKSMADVISGYAEYKALAPDPRDLHK